MRGGAFSNPGAEKGMRGFLMTIEVRSLRKATLSQSRLTRHADRVPFCQDHEWLQNGEDGKAV